MSEKHIMIGQLPIRIVFRGGMQYSVDCFIGMLRMFSMSGSRALVLRTLKFVLTEQWVK